MKADRYEELASLAESIAENSFINGKTDLQKIIENQNILLVEGHYEDCFLGLTVHNAGNFEIYLNIDLLKEDQKPRKRFTLAHEIAHYSIKQHSDLLKQGISLSFNKNESSYFIEKEANHFASFLLMPRPMFIPRAGNFERGVPAILQLANDFETSIDCTSIHYMELDCCCGLLIRWKEDYTISFSCCSKSLSKLTGISNKPPIKLNFSYLDSLKGELIEKSNSYEVLEKATSLNKWIGSIAPGSVSDFAALEQTIKLGNYGGITLVLYNGCKSQASHLV